MLALQYALHHFTAGDHAAELENAALSVRSGAFRLPLAALLLKVVCSPAGSLFSRTFRMRPLIMLGKYGYGPYVYHHFLSYYFYSNGIQSQLAERVGSRLLALFLLAATGVAISMLLAWASYEYFERRFLRLKRFWSNEGARQAGGAGESPRGA
jgi:peptidoglycan/LPS O-acetylase OafA/YrhL